MLTLLHGCCIEMLSIQLIPATPTKTMYLAASHCTWALMFASLVANFLAYSTILGNCTAKEQFYGGGGDYKETSGRLMWYAWARYLLVVQLRCMHAWCLGLAQSVSWNTLSSIQTCYPRYNVLTIPRIVWISFSLFKSRKVCWCLLKGDLVASCSAGSTHKPMLSSGHPLIRCPQSKFLWHCARIKSGWEAL